MLLGVDKLIGLRHPALTVRDLEASAAWYRDVLGMQEEPGSRSALGGMALLRLPGSGHAVGLVQHGGAAGVAAAFDSAAPGLDHLAFSVASRAELDAWEAELDRLGIAHSGIVEIPPGGILNFSDPDGIALALFWDRTRANWT